MNSLINHHQVLRWLKAVEKKLLIIFFISFCSRRKSISIDYPRHEAWEKVSNVSRKFSFYFVVLLKSTCEDSWLHSFAYIPRWFITFLISHLSLFFLLLKTIFHLKKHFLNFSYFHNSLNRYRRARRLDSVPRHFKYETLYFIHSPIVSKTKTFSFIRYHFGDFSFFASSFSSYWFFTKTEKEKIPGTSHSHNKSEICENYIRLMTTIMANYPLRTDDCYP